MKRLYQWCSDNIFVLCVVAIIVLLLASGGLRCSINITAKSEENSTKGAG